MLFGCLSAPSASAYPVITIVNSTGYDCYYLFVSPVIDDMWGDDVLGRDILPNGQSFSMTLPYPLSEVNRYDFMMIDLDDDLYTRMNVLVTNNARIVFTFNDFRGQ
jgi:hypothetical protein